MKRIFVIGDIHGCFKTFNVLTEQLLKINKDDTVYLLGDYIDRGPSSKQVVDKIIELQAQGYDINPIMGNHERMLLDSTISDKHFNEWQKNGCETTLKSFGIPDILSLEKHYLEFFQALPYYYELKNFILIHAGLNFAIENPMTDTDAMLWTRNREFDAEKTGGRKLIVGHTPIPLKLIKLSMITNCIMLDGGCVYLNKYPDMGNLAAIELNSSRLYYKENVE